MPDSAYILHKVAQAFRDYLRAQTFTDITAANIHSSISKDVRNMPCIICQCFSASVTEGSPYSGTFRATVTVQVRSDSEKDADTSHHTRVGEVYDFLAADGIAAALSTQLANFTAFLVVPVSQSFAAQDPHWVSEFVFEVECAGSDIA